MEKIDKLKAAGDGLIALRCQRQGTEAIKIETRIVGATCIPMGDNNLFRAASAFGNGPAERDWCAVCIRFTIGRLIAASRIGVLDLIRWKEDEIRLHANASHNAQGRAAIGVYVPARSRVAFKLCGQSKETPSTKKTPLS